MRSATNPYLIMGGIGSALAAAAHLGCILVGADGYRLMGAGEPMARMAEQGHWYPAVVTAGIATVLALWSLYAFSGAGLIRRLPLLRLALSLIAGVYLIRGVAIVGLMPMFPENSLRFWLISSGICLVLGLFYAVGSYQRWPALSGRKSLAAPANLTADRGVI